MKFVIINMRILRVRMKKDNRDHDSRIGIGIDNFNSSSNY